jgi:ribosomal protein S18 acetylase RimI-like enzyme
MPPEVGAVREHIARVAREDFGYHTLVPQWFWDIETPAALGATYVDQSRHALFVALSVHADDGLVVAPDSPRSCSGDAAGTRPGDVPEGATGVVLGTIAVREDGPAAPPHPQWLAQRYAGPDSCHLVRAYVARGHRRRGVARALVEAARHFAAGAGYTTIYLHTNAAIPGALPFWRAMPTTEIYDSRGKSPEEGGLAQNAVHFELALP